GRGWAPSGRGGSDDGSRERVPSTPSAPASSVSPPRGHPRADDTPSSGDAVAPRRRGRAGSGARASRNSSSSSSAVPVEEKKVVITNPRKVFWPDEGYSKADLIEYYDAVAPWLLPYLRDRPLVLTRFPDGIKGKSFFQKDAPEWVPSWIRTERIHADDADRDIDYFIVNDRESLRYVANMGTIPLHLWSSHLPTLDRPDWLVLDLDPKGAPFACPLRWEEVTARLDPARFTIKTAPARFEKVGDPLAPVLSGAIDVTAALKRLERRTKKSR